MKWLALDLLLVLVLIIVLSASAQQESPKQDGVPVCKGDVRTTCTMERIEYAGKGDWLVRCKVEVKGKEIFNRVLPSPRPQSRDEGYKQMNRFMDVAVHDVLKRAGFVWKKDCEGK